MHCHTSEKMDRLMLFGSIGVGPKLNYVTHISIQLNVEQSLEFEHLPNIWFPLDPPSTIALTKIPINLHSAGK